MRESAEPVTLGGYDLPEGALLMLPQWVLHRDERFWEDAETFDPERWERDIERPEYAYFPFSGGPRQCIGMRFARLELTMALATMVDRITLDVSIDGELSFVPSISLRPENDVTASVRRISRGNPTRDCCSLAPYRTLWKIIDGISAGIEARSKPLRLTPNRSSSIASRSYSSSAGPLPVFRRTLRYCVRLVRDGLFLIHSIP